MKSRWIFLFTFIIIGFGIYFNSLKNGYHYDDWHHIVRNPYIRAVDNIPLYFTEPRTFSTKSAYHSHYRPLLLVSYAFNYHFWRSNPGGYHLVNLGFHVGSAFLVFLILWNMIGSGAIFMPLSAGLLFLTTPFNSEVVNYITARSSAMCAFFYLLAFYFWVRYRTQAREIPSPSRGGTGRGWGHFFYLASLLSFLLAMLTKEVAITLPVVIWLYDLYFVRPRSPENPRWVLGFSLSPLSRLKPGTQVSPRSWRDYLGYVPFFATGIFTGVILRIIFFGQFGRVIGVSSGLPLTVRFLTQVKALARYFFSVLIPLRLSAWHQVDTTPGLTFWVSFIFITGLIALAYLTYRSIKPLWRGVSFFILWFFIALIPTSVIPLIATYQENRGYLAGVGVVGVIGGAATICIERLQRGQWKMLVKIFLGVVLVLYSLSVIDRNSVWRDDLSLCTDILEKYPQAKMAHLCLGEYYVMHGQPDEAEREFRAVLTLDPEDSGALINLGVLSLAKGEGQGKPPLPMRERDEVRGKVAESLFLRSLKQKPNDPMTHFYLGTIYEERGDLDRALVEYLQVLKITPDNMRIPEPLVRVSGKMGMLDRAYKNFSFLKEKDPNNPAVRRALGLIYQQEGRLDLAAREYKETLRLAPEDIPTLMDLGSVYLKMDALPQAEETYKRTLSIWPLHQMARINLARVYERQGRNIHAPSGHKGE